MMADLATPRMTDDEFLVWAEGQDGRWELLGRRPCRDVPERVVHTETKGEAYSALKNAIAVARAPCRALTEGRRGAHRRGNRVRTRRPGVLRATVAGGFAGRFQSRSRRRGAFPWHRRAGSRRQARRLFLA